MPDTHTNETAADTPDSGKRQLINEARDVLRGDRTRQPQELAQLCRRLEIADQFAYACEVLLVKMAQLEDNGEKVPLKDYQRLAYYLYKDSSLPSSFKFERALHELGSHDDLAVTNHCETLGLAGAIYKRKWLFDHQFKNLILARYYYDKGYKLWLKYIDDKPELRCEDENDDGYTAINFAYINELMGIDKLEEHGRITGPSESIQERFRSAKEAREKILAQFTTQEPTTNTMVIKAGCAKWVYATVAEACFGLCRYEAAFNAIAQYLKLPGLPLWEIRSFNQQLLSLAYIQVYLKNFFEANKDLHPGTKDKLREVVRPDLIDNRKINECLMLFTDPEGAKNSNKQSVPEIKKDGKTGLALSGGGFRASLFHIGVLAALAEKDQLRHIEVISCVSGGSIIGAYYYLKLKALLETVHDSEITKEHYIGMVKEIEKDFLAGVQQNLRMRIFSNLPSDFKMIFSRHYSRTHRLGELYEKHLYRQLLDKEEIYMQDLYIQPKLEANEDFTFDIDNWKRKNKIPQLILNATSVNTGHNWRFTASWMGEPPGYMLTDLDVKPRLRRMYYDEAPPRYRNFRLGYAVGASSCVPVMFHPMPMFDLYKDIDLQLIDGGLHDNQGISALIEEECRNMIISDASGQLPINNTATNNEAGIFYRADNILQERLRELQFLDLKERNYTTQLNSLVTVHLKNDLQQNPISWLNCTDPPRTVMYGNNNREDNELTKYGILRHSQELLSEIRTDLDSFNDTEAYALMYSGYAQTHYEMARAQRQTPPQPLAAWDFLQVAPHLKEPEKAAQIQRQLETARKLPFKVMDLSPVIRYGIYLLGVVLFAIACYVGWRIYNNEDLGITIKPKDLIFYLFKFVLGIFLAKIIAGRLRKIVLTAINYKSFIKRYGLYVAITLAGFLVCNIYLACFNKVYNFKGKLPKK